MPATATTTQSSSFVLPTGDATAIDYTEIDLAINLWSEIFPMIEKQIGTLTSVAQEMQECPESQKYVDALLKIAVRVNDVEDKATTCVKEARAQLKKTKLVDKPAEKPMRIRRSSTDDEESDEDGMEIDDSQIDEQVEVSALTSETLEKLQNQMHKVLIKQADGNAFNMDADSRYADFAECLSRMQNGDDDDDDANVVDQVVSNKCPLTQKEFVEPVQNKKCKHKYEKKAVMKYIAERSKARRTVNCPSAGCDNPLSEKDLIKA